MVGAIILYGKGFLLEDPFPLRYKGEAGRVGESIYEFLRRACLDLSLL